MFNRIFGRNKVVSVEEQINQFEKIGIRLKPGISIEQILREWDRKQLERKPYVGLLVAMGGEYEISDTKWTSFSNSVWHFDTECIEDHGDYVRIAEYIRDLSDGYLPLSNIKDYVDIDEGKAWISFEIDGQPYKWDLTVNDDWIDVELFRKFVDLVSSKNIDKGFILMGLGQDCLLCFGTQAQLDELNSLPGLDFVWLKEDLDKSK